MEAGMKVETRRHLSRRDAAKTIAGLAAASCIFPPRLSRADTTVRIGTIKTPHWAATFLLPDYVAKPVQVNLVEFKTSLEMISALTAGSLDIGTIGYWHFVRMLDQGAEVKAVAGLCSGGTRMLVRNGAAISKWEDLRGKTCGAARGSTQEIQFLMALKKHGLAQSDINYRDLGGNAAVHITALQQAQVDTTSIWEPFASQAIEQNVAREFSTLYDDSFRVNALVMVPAAYAASNKDAVQHVIDGLVKATDHLVKTPSAFVDLAVKLSGFSRETIAAANANSFPEYLLRMEDAQKLAAAVRDIGYTKSDVRPKLQTALDYAFLMQSTGKARNELGG
jgi:ABC-type nitrate/sulfonate/bicarbonate transport system substrate-binding protein